MLSQKEVTSSIHDKIITHKCLVNKCCNFVWNRVRNIVYVQERKALRRGVKCIESDKREIFSIIYTSIPFCMEYLFHQSSTLHP